MASTWSEKDRHESEKMMFINDINSRRRSTQTLLEKSSYRTTTSYSI